MPDNTPRLYEGLFLMSQAALTNGLSEALDLVKGMLDHAEAEIVALRKWEDRKLAYPVAGQKRGTYLITHFKAAPFQIANIERDCNLSEEVLRVMFTRCDHFGETELNDVIEEGKNAPVQEELASADA